MMTNDSYNQEDQRTTINRLLNDEQVLVHINPQLAGVSLPEHLMKNRSVTLRLSRYFRGDLTTDDSQVSAELLFGSEYFTCIIPWNSIWGASSAFGEEFLWSNAAPAQFAEIMANEKKSEKAPPAAQPQKKVKTSGGVRGGHLKRVK